HRVRGLAVYVISTKDLNGSCRSRISVAIRRDLAHMPQEPAPPAPALKKIDLTIARLRLLLADVHAREAGIEDQRRMANEQRARLVTFSIYGDATLDSVLAMLADVEERLAHFEAMARSLGAVRKRAEN